MEDAANHCINQMLSQIVTIHVGSWVDREMVTSIVMVKC